MGTNERARITMSEAEVAELLAEARTATLASIGPDGTPHLVAMWYGVVDGQLCFETKAKSQKVVNLRRDPRISCLVEAGEAYDELRGVSIEGVATIVEDHADPTYWAAATAVFERYVGPYDEARRSELEAMMRKRVVVRVAASRVRSWDHRKLGR